MNNGVLISDIIILFYYENRVGELKKEASKLRKELGIN